MLTRQPSSWEWQIRLLMRDWQLFATLTWDPRQLGTRWQRRHHATQWLRRLGARHGTSERRLLYVIRWECGETGGLPHCHILIGGLGESKNWLSSCHIARTDWRQGLAQVRLFNPARERGAAAYLSKGRFSAAWAEGANRYEVAKFGWVGEDSIYISRRAWEQMQLAVETKPSIVAEATIAVA